VTGLRLGLYQWSRARIPTAPNFVNEFRESARARISRVSMIECGCPCADHAPARADRNRGLHRTRSISTCMRARGAFSSPSTTIWRYLIRPSPTQAETSRMKSPTSRPRSGTGRQAQKVRYFLDLSAARGRERISAIFALSVGRFPCRYALRSGSLSFPQKISSSTAKVGTPNTPA